MTDTTSDILILGGGVIGLSVAYHLSKQGAAVTVLDALKPGIATIAAAGMLAPLAETNKPGPFLDLGLASLHRYPAFLAELQELTGNAPEIAGPGMLRVAQTEAEETAQCAAFAWQQETGLPLTRIGQAELRRLEPALGPQVRAAVFSPEERHVPPRLLQSALVTACRHAGAQVILAAEATGLVTGKGRVTAVQTQQGDISVGHLVLCGGAWTAVMGQGLGISLPVTPLRGQALSLGPQSPLPLHHTLYAHSGYIVPRREEQGDLLIVGATEEQVGFDASQTADGSAFLLNMAQALASSFAEVPLHSHWAGLRPVSADGLPFLGRIPGWDNVHVATGHGRNGILLTPITGALMADAILHDAPIPKAFDPARFGDTP